MNLFKNQEPQTVAVNGHDLVCPVCTHRQFWKREAQLNSAVSTFFNLDWADRTATCFVCSQCTYIFWFLGK
jgi:hypothetical protein